MIFVVMFAAASLCGYIMGFIVGKKYAENEIRELRSGADLDTEDINNV